MAITLEKVKKLVEELEAEYADRHAAFGMLRNFWHGRYWQEQQSQSRGITSIFKDLGNSNSSDQTPDVKLVRNILFDVCVKYQTYLSSLPQIRTFVAHPYSRQRREQANFKERVLYGTWHGANMSHSLNQMSWYGPLMGDCFHGIWPDFETNTVKSIVRSPEHAFPVTSYDGSGNDAIIFKWKVPAARAARMFPNWKPQVKKNRWGVRSETQDAVEVLEYTDDREFRRWVDEQEVNGVDHDLGFNLFEQVPFIHIPGEPWNHGAVEQAVSLNEATNMLHSLVMHAMRESVFPKLVLENPMKFQEQLDNGAGAVWAVNEGGKAYYLTGPEVGVQTGSAILAEQERAIKQTTSMPDVNFGNFDASIITGKAINELQGAGTGALVEMVQGAGIGTALVNWNEKALTIYQRMFRDDKISLYGVRPRSSMDLKPQQFELNFKGSDIIGTPRNEVVFSPYVGMHEKLIMGLQGLGAGLYSKAYVREQVGVVDSQAMEEEMAQEAIDGAIIGMIVQTLQNAADPEAGDQAEKQVTGYLEGSGAPAPHPLVGLGAAGSASTGGPASAPAPAGGPPVGPIAPGAPGQAMSPALQLPPGSPPPAAMQTAGANTHNASDVLSLNTVASDFQGLQGITGKVYLVGEIVAQGETSGDIEVALTEGADRQVVADGLPQYAPRLVFHHVSKEPSEQHIDVTPGSPVKAGGTEPSPDQLAA